MRRASASMTGRGVARLGLGPVLLVAGAQSARRVETVGLGVASPPRAARPPSRRCRVGAGGPGPAGLDVLGVILLEQPQARAGLDDRALRLGDGHRVVGDELIDEKLRILAAPEQRGDVGPGELGDAARDRLLGHIRAS